uniref:Uncharacterized protein n=1 Tax=Salix viminalis TaxID=40686 RepID=A0A6N2M6R2_SALVM
MTTSARYVGLKCHRILMKKDKSTPTSILQRGFKTMSPAFTRELLRRGRGLSRRIASQAKANVRGTNLLQKKADIFQLICSLLRAIKISSFAFCIFPIMYIYRLYQSWQLLTAIPCNYTI